MSESSFRVVFDGLPFKDGEISVKHLAPVLLALGDVVQRANRVLSKNQTDARLMLRATNSGSFEAILSIDVSVVDAGISILDAISSRPDRVIAAHQLMDILIKGGTIFGGAGLTVWALVKWLRGNRPSKVEVNEGGTTSLTVNDSTVIVDNRTLLLYEDRPTREAMARFADESLGIDGVDSIKFAVDDDRYSLTLEKSDRLYFSVHEDDSNVTIYQTFSKTVLLNIVTSHFRDGYKWRFSDGGERPFTADVEDVDFLNDVLSGKVSLSAHDVLRCIIREIQNLSAGKITKDVKIEKVIEYIPGPKQLKLL